MDKLKKLEALTAGSNSAATIYTPSASSAPPTERIHCPDYSASDSDEYLTSGRAYTKSTEKSTIYTPLGTSASAGGPGMPDGLQMGELAPEGESFCPWQVVKKYPHVYIEAAFRKWATDEFFDHRKITEETWDFFYIYRGPSDLNLQPILLVPTYQFETFLSKINRNNGVDFTMPTGGANGAFQISFSNDGTPQPRYLGRSSNTEMTASLRNNVPPHYYKLNGEPDAIGTPSDRSLAAFRAKIELMNLAQKGKKVANKERAKKERIEKQQAWSHSIKRVQRYLGLRESNQAHIAATQAHIAAIKENMIEKGVAWGTFEKTYQDAVAKLPPSANFHPDQPAPFQQEGSVVFVCVDVEAYERSSKVITEIGIATLDTLDLIDLVPGEGGKNWMEKIRPRHFRINENKHYVNSDFVAGCADRFEFGDSEFISIKHAPQVVASCFKPPFSGPEEITVDAQAPKRNIILTGHDVGADINYMQTIGYNVTNLSNLLEQADTAIMWRCLQREANPRNLGSILAELGITGWNLHNAGNDAAYTLQAMLAIAIKHIDEKQKARDIKDLEKKTRISEHVKEAVETAVEKEEGWSSGGENSDGGDPIPIVLPPPPKGKKSQTRERNNTAPKEDRGPWKPNPQAEWGANSQQWQTNGWNNWADSNTAQRNKAQWRSESTPGPSSQLMVDKMAKLDEVLKKTTISPEPAAVVEPEAKFDTSRWTNPQPQQQDAPLWT